MLNPSGGSPPPWSREFDAGGGTYEMGSQLTADKQLESGTGRRSRRPILAVLVLVPLVLIVAAVQRDSSTSPAREFSKGESASGFLFVLPEDPDAFVLSNASSFQPANGLDVPARIVLLGVADGDGFDQIVSVSTTNSSPLTSDDWSERDTPTGPAYTLDFPTTVSQQRNSMWLVLRSNTASSADLLTMLSAIAISDTGELRFADSLRRDVIDEAVRPTIPAGFVTYYELTNPNTDLVVSVETAVSTSAIGLAGSSLDRFEPTIVDGVAAWTGTRDDSDGELVGISWRATPNHIVAVSGYTSVEELREIAEQLEITTEGQWNASNPNSS